MSEASQRERVVDVIAQADGRRVIGRRDAGVFVRAVKHHGLQARLPTIAQEVGTLVSDPRQFRQAVVPRSYCSRKLTG